MKKENRVSYEWIVSKNYSDWYVCDDKELDLGIHEKIRVGNTVFKNNNGVSFNFDDDQEILLRKYDRNDGLDIQNIEVNPKTKIFTSKTFEDGSKIPKRFFSELETALHQVGL